MPHHSALCRISHADGTCWELRQGSDEKTPEGCRLAQTSSLRARKSNCKSRPVAKCCLQL